MVATYESDLSSLMAELCWAWPKLKLLICQVNLVALSNSILFTYLEETLYKLVIWICIKRPY